MRPQTEPVTIFCFFSGPRSDLASMLAILTSLTVIALCLWRIFPKRKTPSL